MALYGSVTALAVWLSIKLGQRVVRDSTMFFLTETDRLFAMDARALSLHGCTLLDYMIGTAEVQRFLRAIAEKPLIPAQADEILNVERITERKAFYVIRCRVLHPNQQAGKCTYFLRKGRETEDLLLFQLERRQNWILE